MPVTLDSLSQVSASSHTHHLPAGQQRVADELARPDGNTHEIRQAKLRPLLAGAAGLSVSFFGGLILDTTPWKLVFVATLQLYKSACWVPVSARVYTIAS